MSPRKPKPIADAQATVTRLERSRRKVNSVEKERNQLLKDIQVLRLESELREQSFSGMTHDLINPLAAAAMRTHLVHRVADSPEAVRALLPSLSADLHRADRMIRDFLDAYKRQGVPLVRQSISLEFGSGDNSFELG